MSAVPTLYPVVTPTPDLLEDLPAPERVRRQRTGARAALRASAELCRAELGALEQDEQGAPLPSNGWHWSVSHTRERVAGVVARAPVGLDVERVSPRRSELVGLVTSHDELALLGGFDWRAFARVWTAKEAVLKKAGCGLSELSQCRVLAAPSADLLVLSHRGREHRAHHLWLAEAELLHVLSVTVDLDAEIRWSVRDCFTDDAARIERERERA